VLNDPPYPIDLDWLWSWLTGPHTFLVLFNAEKDRRVVFIKDNIPFEE